MLIVTLSTIPPRFHKIATALESILTQDHPADRIILYVPKAYRRFPDWDGALPKVPDGVEIRRVEKDLGPATKILPAAREFAGQDVDLLFCDDDRIYSPNWIKRFHKLRQKHPSSALCVLGLNVETIADSQGVGRHKPQAVRRWRITDVRFQLHFLFKQILAGRNWKNVSAPSRRVYMRSGYIDIFEGCGGVMVRPEFFDETAEDIPPVLWTVDDVWLSGMIAKSGVPIWLIANLDDPPLTEADAQSPLVLSVIDGADRETANALAVKHMQDTYGIWL